MVARFPASAHDAAWREIDCRTRALQIEDGLSELCRSGTGSAHCLAQLGVTGGSSVDAAADDDLRLRQQSGEVPAHKGIVGFALFANMTRMAVRTSLDGADAAEGQDELRFLQLVVITGPSPSIG